METLDGIYGHVDAIRAAVAAEVGALEHGRATLGEERRLLEEERRLFEAEKHAFREHVERGGGRAAAPPPAPGDVVELNVGGTAYTTTLKTLCSDPASGLAQLFADPGRLPLDGDGRYFLDAAGPPFEYVLRFLRGEKFFVRRSDPLLVDVYALARRLGLARFVNVLEQVFRDAKEATPAPAPANPAGVPTISDRSVAPVRTQSPATPSELRHPDAFPQDAVHHHHSQAHSPLPAFYEHPYHPHHLQQQHQHEQMHLHAQRSGNIRSPSCPPPSVGVPSQQEPSGLAALARRSKTPDAAAAGGASTSQFTAQSYAFGPAGSSLANQGQGQPAPPHATPTLSHHLSHHHTTPSHASAASSHRHPLAHTPPLLSVSQHDVTVPAERRSHAQQQLSVPAGGELSPHTSACGERGIAAGSSHPPQGSVRAYEEAASGGLPSQPHVGQRSAPTQSLGSAPAHVAAPASMGGTTSQPLGSVHASVGGGAFSSQQLGSVPAIPLGSAPVHITAPGGAMSSQPLGSAPVHASVGGSAVSFQPPGSVPGHSAGGSGIPSQPLGSVPVNMMAPASMGDAVASQPLGFVHASVGGGAVSSRLPLGSVPAHMGSAVGSAAPSSSQPLGSVPVHMMAPASTGSAALSHGLESARDRQQQPPPRRQAGAVSNGAGDAGMAGSGDTWPAAGAARGALAAPASFRSYASSAAASSVQEEAQLSGVAASLQPSLERALQRQRDKGLAQRGATELDVVRREESGVQAVDSWERHWRDDLHKNR
ncbi:FH protein interacting protein FIP2 [Diplonema papillatum]|nr:FH protein interacting protein FIP2 [Diplonema papillatum]